MIFYFACTKEERTIVVTLKSMWVLVSHFKDLSQSFIFICDGQGTVRQAIPNGDRSCLLLVLGLPVSSSGFEL